MDIENMNIEKATERCNQLIKAEHANWIGISNQKAIETVLSELEKKEAIINEMSKFIANLKLSWFKKEDGGEFLGKYRFYNQEEWIEYFTNKVEREGK